MATTIINSRNGPANVTRIREPGMTGQMQVVSSSHAHADDLIGVWTAHVTCCDQTEHAKAPTCAGAQRKRGGGAPHLLTEHTVKVGGIELTGKAT